ncbi:uncharacterized protein PADG_12498 [Paracoccidioides brasiliensis Pb18]|uniref:Chromo domain-containing protein n=1 Tax=Paracoccidioides brasiliensis (strain Pb18) TaxID=502780 RepID=A0A0A0HRY3_PARBD|nr:uncharacterized protein PADG_12498 [Paracoccidioides brasiliensis Pb18]KGM91412.1 hypothetical protein PADG_12498 [Paracoccidioides brasiliensis Pb18]
MGTNHLCKKLDMKYNQYTVLEKIESHAYQLNIPPSIHNVFNVKLLHAAVTDPLPSQRQTDWQPPTIETLEGPEFEIEEICDEQTYQRKKQYLIKWVGWAEPMWNDMSLLQEVKALNTWEASQQTKLGVKRTLNSHKGLQQRGRRGVV